MPTHTQTTDWRHSLINLRGNKLKIFSATWLYTSSPPLHDWRFPFDGHETVQYWWLASSVQFFCFCFFKERYSTLLHPAAPQMPLCRRRLGSKQGPLPLWQWLGVALTTRLDLIVLLLANTRWKIQCAVKYSYNSRSFWPGLTIWQSMKLCAPMPS
jgi:hypothetical protein